MQFKCVDTRLCCTTKKQKTLLMALRFNHLPILVLGTVLPPHPPQKCISLLQTVHITRVSLL